METEELYKQTKINVAHYINTSDDIHIKLVKSFQKKKEDKNLKSVFKDAKRYAYELHKAAISMKKPQLYITHDDQVTVVSTKEPRSIKEILRPLSRREELKSCSSPG
mgnify:CR=1 FL=1